MLHAIAQVLDRIRAFFVPHGRHRPGSAASAVALGCSAPSAVPTAPQPGTSHPTIAPTVRLWYEPLDGTATPLVRPYLAIYEREEQARLHRLRRDTLWWATYGIDLDTRDVHARLEVA